MEELNVQKGDRVRVRRWGRILIGRVYSAYNYGTPDDPDWYIELENGDYVKQLLDNAQIEVLEKAEQHD